MTGCYPNRMVDRMKTTLNIDDAVMTRLRHEAARRQCTLAELVETALKLLLQHGHQASELPPLPAFNSGGQPIDIADSDALIRVMEAR